MTRRSPNYDRTASLELSLAATKSLVSDYSLRARQAEEAFARLVHGLDKQNLFEFEAAIGRHVNVRAHERAVHQQAILQATLVAIGAALEADEESRKQILQQVFKDLTISVQHLSQQPTPASK